MFKIILCCLLLTLAAPTFSNEFVYNGIIDGIMNGNVIKCSGEPVWVITLPFANDGWMAGRLDALSQSGFTRRSGETSAWLLTPTGAFGVLGSRDDCLGRMLVHP